MRHVKILSMTTMALVALLAFASSALATTATSPKGTTYTGKIVAQVEKEATLTGPFGFGTITCEESAVEGNIETHGSEEAHTLEGNITKLTFGKCTGGTPTSPVVNPGKLVVHTTTKGVNNSDGTVTSTAALVVVHGTAVGTCTFVTNNTDIGWITGSTTRKGSTATFDINGQIPNDGSNPFCGSTATWEGSYIINTPDYLDID